MIELLKEYSILFSMSVAIVMIVSTTLVHFEILQIFERIVPKTSLAHGRISVVFVVLVIFLAHIIAIWLYALCFYLMVQLGLGGLEGSGGLSVQGNSLEYLYYSITSYTSLGLGDMFPTGDLRFLTGVEALNGLVLITWSASYTYLYMTKFWK